MSQPQDDAARSRELRLEIEVPGTPEQVWAAIATGPGITAWFVPTEVAEHEGGRVVMDFGPGLGADEGRVDAWEPPHRFLASSSADGGQPMAFEWLVEARSGGTCLVRLVNSGFGSGDDWDRQYDSMRAGWLLFLSNLRLYLTHFRGQLCRSILVNGQGEGTRADVWARLTGALGLPPVAEGDRVATGPDAPVLGGTVERVSEQMLTLLVDEPARGVAFVAAEGWPDRTVHTSLYGYFFGEDAAEVAAREEPIWRAWMARHFG